jgi:protein-S-isoprenylcysteine O-methyltransferase Ste14
MYDLFMRLPFLVWVLVCSVAQSVQLIYFINVAASIDSVYVIHIATRLSTIAFTLLLAYAVILRTRPSVKARGLEPRISALAGTFMIYAIALSPRRELSLPLEIISIGLTLIGTVGAIVALRQLGRSFSVMAETRQLVTSGPYQFVRHPLYLTEQVAMVGVFIQFASAWTAILLVIQIALQLRRMHNEEVVLTASFSEYAAYRRNTARLIPGVY